MTQTQKKPGWLTIALVPLGLAAVMTPAILLAASGDNGTGFDAVVHGIEQKYNVRANRIPFMGLISFVAGRATHGGVRGLHVAEIENVQGSVDGEELNALVEQNVGKGWQRIIRETSRSGNEQSLIFVRPEGDHMGMMVVDLDGHEMNVVQMSLNPDQLKDEIQKHDHHGRNRDASGDEKPSDGAGESE
jgi:hypothetical protein